MNAQNDYAARKILTRIVPYIGCNIRENSQKAINVMHILHSRITNHTRTGAIVLMMFAASGCSTIQKAIQKWPYGNAETNAPSQQSGNSGQLLPSGKLWAAQAAPDFFQHGNPGENAYRDAAVTAGAATGCLRVRADFGMGDELAMHLLALEHPNNPGYYLEQDGWFFQAERRGVTRWVHDLGTPTMAQAERWLWLNKSPRLDGRLQYVVSASTSRDVVDRVKTSGREVVIE